MAKGNKGGGNKSGAKATHAKMVHHTQKPSAAKPSSNGSTSSNSTSSTPASKSGLSSLQQKFSKKLEGARFRIINEQLYTSRGCDAFAAFQEEPAQFEIYHTGFREQCSYWPYNPLDGIIKWISTKHKKAVVADMGCGDARLAASVPNTVHSFDLVSNNPRVVACDIADVPLKDQSVDIVVFCLALMGTNIADFVREAHRILKPNGIMRVAEVRSRFDGEGISIKKFTKFLKRAGFDIEPHDIGEINKMFFEVECHKTDRQSFIAQDFTAKPCVYKKR